MKLKDFQTPFTEQPRMMELLVLEGEPLPVLCVGATRDKQTRSKQLSLVNPNYPPEKLAKHMSSELGWGELVHDLQRFVETCTNSFHYILVQCLVHLFIYSVIVQSQVVGFRACSFSAYSLLQYVCVPVGKTFSQLQ